MFQKGSGRAVRHADCASAATRGPVSRDATDLAAQVIKREKKKTLSFLMSLFSKNSASLDVSLGAFESGFLKPGRRKVCGPDQFFPAHERD